jgi:fructose 1,6-bisphosphate aldolase/phosphatase
VDLFAHPFWDAIRNRAADKAVDVRRQGFSGAAMLPYSELEYGGIVEILEKLDTRFRVETGGGATGEAEAELGCAMG